MSDLQKPIPRSPLRARLGRMYYGAVRKLVWLLKDVDMRNIKSSPKRRAFWW